jgi:protein SCO1/2
MFWVFFVIVGMTWPIVRNVTMDTPARLPIRGSVGNFRLINQHGQAFGSAELKNRVWVAAMVCTECPYASPEFTDRFAAVQHRSRGLGDAFHMVTFTMDPESDTPERLLQHAIAKKTSRSRWSFLTGPTELVKQAMAETFGMLMPRKKRGDPPMKGFNSERSYALALIDQRMQIRGYYDCRDDAEIDKLMSDLGLVANRIE